MTKTITKLTLTTTPLGPLIQSRTRGYNQWRSSKDGMRMRSWIRLLLTDSAEHAQTIFAT